MPPEHYTILVLSREQSRFRKLRLSHRAVVALGSVLGVLVLTGAALTPTLLVRLNTASAEARRMTHENLQLRQQKEEIAESISSIESRLERFEADAGRLAEELGVLDLAGPAVGGESPIGHAPQTVGEQELESLSHRLLELDNVLAELGGVAVERRQRMASTPSGMPVEGWFSHGYGWRKDPWTSEPEFHGGMDIVAFVGTPVMATGDGVVSKATRKSDYGKVIDISHGYGYVTRYAHLSEILVRPAQKVRRGDVIGRVGSSGRSTGPHLHYEVFHDRNKVNPRKYLDRDTD